MYVTETLVFLQAFINSKSLVFAVSSPLYRPVRIKLGLLCLEHTNIVDEQ